ncbi:MAG: class I SAM-dependent methyltransferase [Patescibacteria group bacterium]|nr:class I SAM-dependent methyltransferase [Patescibacteria group bacterium]
MLDANKFDKFYRSPAGEKMAGEELLPVIGRYRSAGNLKILEVGCGYGRNIAALSGIKDSEYSGCDISAADLEQAKKRAEELGRNNIELFLQPDKNKLPFAANQFDLAVLWQVLEHVPTRAEKKSLLAEVSRVVKNNGLVLVETPNFFFPVDYHDTNLPLANYFPASWRAWLIRRIRKQNFPPSFYTDVLEIKKFLASAGDVIAVKKASKIFFEKSYSDIFKHLGGTRQGNKKAFFVLYFPLYCLLRALKIDGDLFTPSVRAVFRVEKK